MKFSRPILAPQPDRFHKTALWKWILLLVGFLAAQTAAVIHAEIHAFHEHTEYCEAFEQVAQPTLDSPEFQPLLKVELPSIATLLLKPPAGQSQFLFSYSVRAPPALS